MQNNLNQSNCNKKSKVKFFLLIALLVILFPAFFILLKIKIIGPYSGMITDARTGMPIPNMKIYYSIKGTCGALVDSVSCDDEYEFFSDKDGHYYIPRKIFFRPLGSFDGITLLFNSSNEVTWFDRSDFIQRYEGKYGGDYNKSYFPIKYIFCKKNNKYCEKKEDIELMLVEDYFKSTFSLNINLVPKVKSINECQEMIDSDDISKCIIQNDIAF